jgi:hypothetical protein
MGRRARLRDRARLAVDVNRLGTTALEYLDTTVAAEIQRLKVARDRELGLLAVRHTSEIRTQSERHARERRLVWDDFNAARRKLLASVETREVA